MKIFLIGKYEKLQGQYVLPLKDKFCRFYEIKSDEDVIELFNKNCIPNVALIYCNKAAVPGQELFSGENNVLFIKEKVPQCKIFVITTHTKALALYYISRTLNPRLLLAETSNFTSTELLHLLRNPLDKTIFCNTVKQAIDKIKDYPLLMQTANTKILILLAWGFKVAEIAGKINLSQSAVQKRICKLLREFKASGYRELIRFLKNEELI